MNKKIIAIAIASALTAPAAMADVKISGVVGAGYAFTSIDETAVKPAPASGIDGQLTASHRQAVQSGESKLQFDFSNGMGYGRYAMNISPNLQSGAASPVRDMYVGLKGGFGAVQVGRMAGAMKNIEKDPYIASFLQVRGTAAAAGGAYGSSGFVSGITEYSNKFSGVAVKVQYDPNTGTAGKNATDGETEFEANNSGYFAFSVKGKVGPATIWYAQNSRDNAFTTNAAVANTEAAQTSVTDSGRKIGASMSFGKIKVTGQYESTTVGAIDATTPADTEVAAGIRSGAGGENTRILVMADMGLGNGLSVNGAYGTKSGFDVGAGVTSDVAKASTFLRIAVRKNLNKGLSVYAGYVSKTHEDNTYRIVNSVAKPTAAVTNATAAALGDTTSSYGVGIKMKF